MNKNLAMMITSIAAMGANVAISLTAFSLLAMKTEKEGRKNGR